MSKKTTRLTVSLNLLLYASLGLPDSIFGSAWPVIHRDFSLNVELISVVTAIALSFSLGANLFYLRIKKMRIGTFILASLIALIIGLFLVAIAPNAFVFFVAIPFIGLGQGALDVSVNSFVASRFSSKVLNLVHAFFGLGITVSSLLIAASLALSGDYRWAVTSVLLIQLIILGLFFPQRKLFQRRKKRAHTGHTRIHLSLKNWLFPLFSLLYQVEQALGIFLASYLVFRHYSVSLSALVTSIFWLCITSGRLISVRLSDAIGKENVIHLHAAITLVGALSFLYIPLWSALLIGYGLAPLYPIFMEMPYSYFDLGKSARIVGLNVSASTVGILLLPLLYSACLQLFDLSALPPLVLINSVLTLAIGFLAMRWNREG